MRLCAVREPCLEYALDDPGEGRRLGRPDRPRAPPGPAPAAQVRLTGQLRCGPPRPGPTIAGPFGRRSVVSGGGSRSSAPTGPMTDANAIFPEAIGRLMRREDLRRGPRRARPRMRPRGGGDRRPDRRVRGRAAGQGRDRFRARRARTHDARVLRRSSRSARAAADRHLRDGRRPVGHGERVDDGRARSRPAPAPGSRSTGTGRVVAAAARPTCSRRSASSSISGPSGVARCIDEAGIGFCFAPRYHPALRFVGQATARAGRPHDVQLPRPAGQPRRCPAPGRRGLRPGDGRTDRRRARRARRRPRRSCSTATTASTS